MVKALKVMFLLIIFRIFDYSAYSFPVIIHLASNVISPQLFVPWNMPPSHKVLHLIALL